MDELAKSYKPGSETHLAPRSFKLIKIPCAAMHRHIATKLKAWQGGEIAGVAVCNTRLTYAGSNNVKTLPQLLICAITQQQKNKLERNSKIRQHSRFPGNHSAECQLSQSSLASLIRREGVCSQSQCCLGVSVRVQTTWLHSSKSYTPTCCARKIDSASVIVRRQGLHSNLT